MLICERPENRTTFKHNTKNLWYIGICFNHYRTFKAILPSTGAEKMSDTGNTKYHTITVPTLTPVEIFLKAAHQLDSAIKQ